MHARIGGTSSASPPQYSEEEDDNEEDGIPSVVVSVVVVVVVVVSYLAQTLSLPPTMKQPGHNLTLSLKETRSFVPSSETSNLTSSHEKVLICSLISSISGGVAIVRPSHAIDVAIVETSSSPSIKSISRTKSVRSNVRHVRCPRTPETEDIGSDGASSVVENCRRGFTVVNATSTSEGHAFKSKPTFGFHPKTMFGLTTATDAESVFIASVSQMGSRNVINDSIFLLCTCLKEKRKFEYPPTRNSPGSKTTFFPKVTLGPISSIVSDISSHDTSFLPSSVVFEENAFGRICAPQHAKINSSLGLGSYVVSPETWSSTATALDHSKGNVTPAKDTGSFTFAPPVRVTTIETYVSLAASTTLPAIAPSRNTSSEGDDDHV